MTLTQYKPPPEPDAVLWNVSRKNHTPVAVTLVNGSEYHGVVQNFGKYSVHLLTEKGPVVIFKTAMLAAILCDPKSSGQ